jgi:hypothetical protein
MPSQVKQLHESIGRLAMSVQSGEVHGTQAVTMTESSAILPFDVTVRDCRYDSTFKILFGEDSATERTISFVNEVLQLKGDDTIKSIVFLPTEKPGMKTDRTMIFDLKIEASCESHKGERFIIEMRKAGQQQHTNRWVHYGATELARVGQRVEDLG